MLLYVALVLGALAHGQSLVHEHTRSRGTDVAGGGGDGVVADAYGESVRRGVSQETGDYVETVRHWTREAGSMGWRHMGHVGTDCAQMTHWAKPQHGMRSLALDVVYEEEQIVQGSALSGLEAGGVENRWASLWLAEQ